jgi:hypothetical protein
MNRSRGTLGGKKNAYRMLVRKFAGNSPLREPRRRSAEKIKTDLRDIGDDMDWIHLAEDDDQ